MTATKRDRGKHASTPRTIRAARPGGRAGVEFMLPQDLRDALSTLKSRGLDKSEVGERALRADTEVAAELERQKKNDTPLEKTC